MQIMHAAGILVLKKATPYKCNNHRETRYAYDKSSYTVANVVCIPVRHRAKYYVLHFGLAPDLVDRC
jgi:hypothetical protein